MYVTGNLKEAKKHRSEVFLLPLSLAQPVPWPRGNLYSPYLGPHPEVTVTDAEALAP